MLTPRIDLMRRVMAALDTSPPRIPVLVGGCGSGRTTLLLQLRERLGRTALYLDVERIATTPERFRRAIIAGSSGPVSSAAGEPGPGPRAAFDATLAFLCRTRNASGEPMTVLLDEFLELRTFESFPGLRRVLHDAVDGLSQSDNRFVLTSRYVARTLRLLRDRSPRFEVIHMPALSAEDTLDLLGPVAGGSGGPGSLSRDADVLARAVSALADGRPAYVRAMVDELALMRAHRGGGPVVNDPVSALAALLGPNGNLSRQCRFCYELRLHRARGYGALKAILEILAEEEGLTLTEISQRLHRTPGSTKDYLSWLEDVDLVTARQKRYSYADPMLRAWVRLHCRATAPTEDDLAREIHHYAQPRLPHQPDPRPQPPEAAYALASASPSGIIEID